MCSNVSFLIGICVWLFLFSVSVCSIWFISVHLCICMHMFDRVCVPLWCLCVRGTCVRGPAQESAPPCGWHSECIITINEKVNGAFSYISIYIWTIWVHKWCLGGRGHRHSALKKRGLMCFCGHQMLWIMTRPLNANQMSLDRPWSTVPAWKLSPTDTMKEKENRKPAISWTKHFLLYYTFQIWCKIFSYRNLIS